MIEKLEIKEDGQILEDQLQPWDIAHDAKITNKEDVQSAPALSLGWYSYKLKQERIIFGSYGDFSCIVGASKSMKTKLKIAMCAAYLGEGATNHFNELRGIGNAGKYIIDIDTEQSRFHVKRMRQDILEMCGKEDDPRLITFALRKYDPAERLKFLKWVCYESEYAGNIGLVCVDGAADLIEDSNDLVSSQALTNLFMKITEEQNCHLITILHRTKSSNKPTGHIGSAILKKAETVAFVNRDFDTDEITVTPEYTRNYPFRPFTFKLDKNYLPTELSMLDNIFDDE